MRVVLDANIFISFLMGGGETISSVLRLWEEREFLLLASEEIIKEYKSVSERFAEKGYLKKTEADELLWWIKNEAYLMKITSVVTTSPDKKDNRYLACALDGKADFLVTGDKKHLLPLKKISKTKIVSPKEFLKVFKT